MAIYPIKMLKDEQNVPFVPLVSTQGIQDPEGLTLEQRLSTKLGPTNLHGGTNISVRTEGYDCYIDLDLPSSLTIIDNLTTTTSGQGALDAHQGYVLKNLIPSVIDDITSTSTISALSANQGRILNGKIPSVNNTLTSTSTTQALSAYQGKLLNDKFNNYLPLTGGTLTGQLNIDVNTYGNIILQNSNGPTEASIRYRHTDYNSNGKEFVAGYGTATYDGYGIWANETNKNVWTVDKNGNAKATGYSTGAYPNDRVYIGSQVIYPGADGNGEVSKTSVIGAYQYTTIDGVFTGITIPSGWHKEYRLTAQVSTGGSNTVQIFLNNIATNAGGTWSNVSFRMIVSSGFFKESDVVLEPTLNYGNSGINLKYQVTGGSSRWQFWSPTIHGYLVKD